MSAFIPEFFERYWDRYIEEPMSGCWLWHASQTTSGYGNITFGGSNAYAHRASYEAVHGEGSTDGWLVRHRCDNPSCINPDHLLIGTHLDNAHDAWSRGRMNPLRGEASSKVTLTESIVLQARKMAAAGMPLCDIAATLGESRNSLQYAVTGDTWSHLPGAVPLSNVVKAGFRTKVRSGQEAAAAKLSDNEVRDIRRRLASGETGRALAKSMAVSVSTISAIKVGRKWSHVR